MECTACLCLSAPGKQNVAKSGVITWHLFVDQFNLSSFFSWSVTHHKCEQILRLEALMGNHYMCKKTWQTSSEGATSVTINPKAIFKWFWCKRQSYTPYWDANYSQISLRTINPQNCSNTKHHLSCSRKATTCRFKLSLMIIISNLVICQVVMDIAKRTARTTALDVSDMRNIMKRQSCVMDSDRSAERDRDLTLELLERERTDVISTLSLLHRSIEIRGQAAGRHHLAQFKIPLKTISLRINFYQWLNMSGKNNKQFQLPSSLLWL